MHNCLASNSIHGGNKTVVNLIPLSQKDFELVDFINYIAAYVKLLTNLCKGRNEQFISEVTHSFTQITAKEVGLDSKFCLAILEEKN